MSAGIPAHLLQYQPDIRQAERELAAPGLDVKVARAHFYPRIDITGGVGYEAFNPTDMFLTPESLIGSIARNLVVPLLNKKAIQAEYKTANAKQLQALYNYQRVILTAFTEVVNRMSKVENYGKKLERSQRIDRRTGSPVDGQRRNRQQKRPPLPCRGGLAERLKVAVVENRRAHRHDDHPVHGHWKSFHARG
jgi:outer membrane protein, multidrug efflux system